jgi:gliding motility-associated-like protein
VNGCTGSNTVSVTGPTAVTVNAVAAPTTICIGQTSNLTANPAGGTGSGYTYTWTPVGTGSTQTVTVSPAVTTVYTVVVTDGNGCAAPPATVTVTVNPALNVNLVANPTPVCTGTPSTLTANANGGNGGPYTYNWLPVGTAGNTSTANVSPAVTTTYTVILSDGCTTPDDSAFVTVVVNPPPAPSFTGNPLTGCAPLIVNFMTPNNPSWTTCAWDFGDGSPLFSGNCNPTHTYVNPGCYDVTLTVTDANGCVGTITVPNYVCVSPNVVAQFTASPQPTDIFNTDITFTDQSTGGAISWQWYFDVLDSSNLQNPVYTFPNDAPGCYDVVLIANNLANCPGVDTMQVCIDPDYVIYFPNAFTPDGDGLNDNFIGVGEGIKKYEMWIFDRWGNMLYYTDDITKPWNGTVAGKSGKVCQEDVYVWKANVVDVFDKKHKFIGHVTLIR